MTITVTKAPTPIPMGCVCSYTWRPFPPGGVTRNGALLSCPADHSEVDGR